MLSNETFTDIVSADYGPRWEALRRVAHSAVQYVFPQELPICEMTLTQFSYK